MEIRRYTFKIEENNGSLYNQENERIFILSDIGKETRERCKKCAHTFTLNDTDFWPDLVYMISYDLYFVEKMNDFVEKKNDFVEKMNDFVEDLNNPAQLTKTYL